MQTGNKKSKAIKPDLTISMQDGTTYQLARIKKRHYMPMHPDQQETSRHLGNLLSLFRRPHRRYLAPNRRSCAGRVQHFAGRVISLKMPLQLP